MSKYLQIEFSKEELSLLLDALETEIDKRELCIESWKKAENGVLKRVYGENRYDEIISNDTILLNDFNKLETKIHRYFKSVKKVSK